MGQDIWEPKNEANSFYSQTGDGGYIFTGRSGSNPSGSWVAKLTNDTVVPDNSPARETQNEFTILWTKIYNDKDAVEFVPVRC